MGDEQLMSYEEKNLTLIEHLEDLRKIIIVSIVSIIVASIVIFAAFREPLMALILMPMERLGIPLVFISPTEGFITQIKASFFAGIFAASPIVLWQVWSFILPALHSHERKYILSIVPASFLLFLFGISFAYFMVFPLATAFLVGVAEGLSPMISIGRYLSFLISFTLPFGLVFQLPLVILVLTRLGFITPQFLIEKRKYALLSIVVLSAMLTPPDVISLSLMAAPMVVLYEISILLSKLFGRKKHNPLDDQGSEE